MKDIKYNIQAYSLFTASLLLVKDKARAEAVYSDIPDTVIDTNMELFDIDMNYDGILDYSVLKRSFNFLVTTYSSGYVTSHLSIINAGPKVVGNYMAGFSVELGSGGSFISYYPYALSAGINIDVNLSFQHDGLEIIAFRYTTDEGANSPTGGEWYPEMLDHFLGVYFKDTIGCYHYGWIRCDVKNSGKEITVKDFAYERKCDVGIKAGDIIGDTVTVEIEEENSSLATVYSFNKSVYINLNEFSKGVEICIHDLGGKVVYSEKLTSLFNKIELSDAEGIYVVNLSDGKNKLVKKVFLK